MTKKERALLAVEALKKEYPGAVCSLEYQDPLQLLIATRLSAQCTDARVNLVTPALFARFPTLEAFCEGSEEEIAELIRSCGLYKTKARDIFAMCHVLRDSYNGVIPDTVDELTKLPGVGRSPECGFSEVRTAEFQYSGVRFFRAPHNHWVFQDFQALAHHFLRLHLQNRYSFL